jgi:hypothetical protein
LCNGGTFRTKSPKNDLDTIERESIALGRRQSEAGFSSWINVARRAAVLAHEMLMTIHGFGIVAPDARPERDFGDLAEFRQLVESIVNGGAANLRQPLGRAFEDFLGHEGGGHRAVDRSFPQGRSRLRRARCKGGGGKAIRALVLAAREFRGIDIA